MAKLYYDGKEYDEPNAAWSQDAPAMYRQTPESLEQLWTAGYGGKGYKEAENNYANLSPLEQAIFDKVSAKGQAAEAAAGLSGGYGGGSFGGGYSSYSNPYAEQLNSVYGQIMNRQPFSYDYTTDPLYQQYQKEYTRLGQRAMDDTLAKISARTGGLASSYAASAGNQAYGNYMQQLSDKIPELEQYAYGKYNDEGNWLLNQLNLLRGLDSDAYNRFANERAYGDSRGDLAYQRAWNENERDYARALDAYNQQWNENERDYKRGQESDARAVYAFSDDGGDPYRISSLAGLNYLNSLPEGTSVTGGDGSTWTKENGQIVIAKDGKTYRYGEATAPAYGGYVPPPGDGNGNGNITVNMGDIAALGRGPMSAEQAVQYAIDNGYYITIEDGQYRIKKPSLSNGPLNTNLFGSMSDKYKK